MGKRFSKYGSTSWERWRADPSLAWQITRTRRGAVLDGFPSDVLTPHVQLLLAVFGRGEGARQSVPAWVMAEVRKDCAGLDGH